MTSTQALASVLGYTAIYIGVLIWRRSTLVQKLGPQGLVLLWGFSLSFLLPALGWIVGISDLVNDSDNPVMQGVGGYYGLNYTHFPAVIAVYMLPPGLALIGSLMLPRQVGNRRAAGSVLIELGSHLRVERIAYVALVISCLLVIWYFSVVGWNRFWSSDLDRFEASSDVSVEFSIKIALTFILAIGCLGAALAILKGVFVVSTLIVAIAALPFVAFASRGMTVLMTAFAVSVFFRVRASRRWLVLFPLVIGIYLSLRLPLVMRNYGQTGISVAAQHFFDIDQQNTGFSDSVAASFLNIGQGFGLMVEEREASASGTNIALGIPIKYYLLSISPTISLVDGFSRNFLYMHPRFNIYTPYSGLCELMALSPLLAVGFPLVCFFLGILLCRRAHGVSLWHNAGLFSFALLMTLGFLQLQQYPLRTATRFLYAACALYGCLAFVAFVLKTHAAGKPMAKILNIFAQPTIMKPLKRATAQMRRDETQD